MKKTFILAFIAVGLLAMPAGATETRVLSLSGASDYVWDNSNVFTYPSVGPLYYRSMVAELGDEGSDVASQSSVWLLYADQEQSFGVAGLAINRHSAGYGQLLDHLLPVQNDSFSVDIITRLQDRGLGQRLTVIEEPKASYDLLYSRRFDKITGGILLGRSAWSGLDSYSGEERKADAGITELGLGVGYEPGENLRADATVSYNHFSFGSSYSYSGQDSAQEFRSDGSQRLAFDGRIFYALNEDMVIVPLVKAGYTDLAYRYTQNGDTNSAAGSNETTQFLLGCGWNYQFRNHLKLIAGADLGYSKSLIEDSLIVGSPGEIKEVITEWTFPAFHLGLEANLADWITVRLGATQSVVSVKHSIDFADGTSSRSESSEQPYQLNLGLTLKTGNLNLDLLVNPELLYSGGNIASGSKTWPATSAALSYRF
ncbi:MAG: hypothetical protein RDU76_07510 [Candidatus Edwardsbacteria bacterium]|nr:hypothetical protein [Candidatus Edwardsbacteria bacterium]